MGTKSIGILALQGGFALHASCVKKAGAHVTYVRKPEDLAKIDGLIVPGGESTTMHLLMERTGLFSAIQKEITQKDLAYFGTCAGLILAAKKIQNQCEDRHNDKGFACVDMTVERNAYGRQNDSFETKLYVPALERSIQAVFIRAPKIISYENTLVCLAKYEETPVLLGSRRSLFATFHPELSNTAALHDYWIQQL